MSDTGLTGRDADLSLGVSWRDHLPRVSPTDGRMTASSRPITAEKVVAVLLNPDDELRNLQVAMLYSMSSRRMDAKIFPYDKRHPDTATNANWFTMAQWAVLTVGRNMRTRDVPTRVSGLPSTVRRRVTPAVLSLRVLDDRRIAAALSFGQVMVLVSTYRAFLKSCLADGRKADPYDVPLDPDSTATVIVQTDDDPGEAPPANPATPAPAVPDPTEGLLSRKEEREILRMARDHAQDQASASFTERAEEGQRRLVVLDLAARMGVDCSDIPKSAIGPAFYSRVLDRLAEKAGHQKEIEAAFELYEQALPVAQAEAHRRHDEGSGPAPRDPSDLVFEANLRLGAIEQIILDEAVTMVIDHVPNHLSQQLEGRLAMFAERTLRVPKRIAQVNASRRIALASAIGRDLWARVMTEQILVLSLPAETIRLGRDLPCRDWRKPFYAEALTNLSPTAQALFDAYDRSLGDGRRAGAGDWRRWDDRLNFVANLMRSRHDDPSLFWQPFTDEDMTNVWEGRYPSRVVDPFEQAVRSPFTPVEFSRDLEGIDHLCVPPGK